MCSLFCFVQIEACSSGHNFFLMLQIYFQSLFQCQNDRFSVNQCQHICTEGFLQRCIFIQLVQNDIGIGVFFHFNDDLDIITGGCIIQITDAFHTFFLYKVCDLFDQTQFIDHVRNFGDNDTFSAVMFFDFRCGTHDDLSAACSVSRTDAAFAQNIRTSREVGALDVFHQFFHFCFPAIDLVIDHADDAINDLTQIVGRDICRHTNCDTAGTIHQQVGDTGRQHGRFFFVFVIVGNEINSVFFNIRQHFRCDLGHTCFGITAGSCAVAINRAEVPMTVYQHITHGEILRHTHHSLINGGITVGVIFTHGIADDTCGFTIALVGVQIHFVHGIQDTTLNGLQTVAGIGQCTGNNNAHGIVDVAFLHFLVNIYGYDFINFFIFVTHKFTSFKTLGASPPIPPPGHHALDLICKSIRFCGRG